MTAIGIPPASGAGGWFFEPLIPLSFELLMVDPPWEMELYSDAGAEKSQMAHYDVMTDEDVFALPVDRLASMNALLLLWSTAPRLDVALEAVRRWGFTYRSYMIWRKVSINGKVMMGPGYRVRTTGEILIVATLGDPVQSWKPQTIFDGVRREHSRKPEEAYALAERIMPRARRLDLFSRQSRPGWTTWGFERTKFDAGSAAQGKRDVTRRSSQRDVPQQPSLFGDAEAGK